MAVAAVLVALTSTSCADEASTEADNRTSTAGTAPSTEAVAPAAVTVDINDKTFSTDDVVVKVGGTVTWVNSDTVDHQVLSADSDVIRSPVLSKGGSYTALFTAPGEYPFYCNIHNFMKGTVVVR